MREQGGGLGDVSRLDRLLGKKTYRSLKGLTKTRTLCVTQIKQRPIDINKSRTPATRKARRDEMIIDSDNAFEVGSGRERGE